MIPKTLSSSFARIFLRLILASNVASAQNTISNITDTQTAQSIPSITTIKVGDFVAAGVGLTSIYDYSTSDRSMSVSSQTQPQSFPSLRADHNMSKTYNTTDASSLSPNDSACWSAWSHYWANYYNATYAFPNATTVYTRTDIFTTANVSETTIHTTTTFPASIYTLTRYDGKFSIGLTTISQAATTSTYDTIDAQTLSVSTWTQSVETFTATESALTTTITAPPCVLPSYVPECQSTWLSYLSSSLSSLSDTSPNNFNLGDGQTVDYARPLCTQASIRSDGDLCWSLRDNYVSQYKDYAPNLGNGIVGGSRGTTATTNGTTIQTTVWPTDWPLAPSCTLGCARCAITGGSVQLFYWPVTSTFSLGQKMTTLGTTLTYPTVYISYEKIYANNSCGPVGPTITSTILAVSNTNEISSIYGYYTTSAHAMNILVDPPGILTRTASFNFTDLDEPVPYSIYSQQPWCMSDMFAISRWPDPFARSYTLLNTTFPTTTNLSATCSTTDSYKPILYLPSDILNRLDPAWATCSGDIGGVYDPPKALTSVDTVATPTVPNSASTTPAAPSSALDSPTPVPTSVLPIPHTSTSPTQSALVASLVSTQATNALKQSTDAQAMALVQSSTLNVASPVANQDATGSTLSLDPSSSADPAETSSQQSPSAQNPEAAVISLVTRLGSASSTKDESNLAQPTQNTAGHVSSNQAFVGLSSGNAQQAGNAIVSLAGMLAKSTSTQAFGDPSFQGQGSNTQSHGMTVMNSLPSNAPNHAESEAGTIDSRTVDFADPTAASVGLASVAMSGLVATDNGYTSTSATFGFSLYSSGLGFGFTSITSLQHSTQEAQLTPGIQTSSMAGDGQRTSLYLSSISTTVVATGHDSLASKYSPSGSPVSKIESASTNRSAASVARPKVSEELTEFYFIGILVVALLL